MPYSVWKDLSLPELTPTCMTLELADRSITEPIGIAKDVRLMVGKFQFLADFVVVDFEPDPRVPLILGRSFLKTSRALIDVYEGEITLRVGKEAITFNLDQTSRYTANYDHMTANRIDIIKLALFWDDLDMGSTRSRGYVPGLRSQSRHLLNLFCIPFVPEPVYPEFLPGDDEVFPAEEQPMPAADSPTHQSPGYISESGPEEDLEEDDKEDPEEDPADYPADRADQDPYIAYRITARMSIRPQAPAPFLSEEVAERVLALPTPPPSPLSPYSSPLPQITSPPLPIPSPIS
ncbi:reverse transcriptase domain-containing protein [Tanacetum coccineum]